MLKNSLYEARSIGGSISAAPTPTPITPSLKGLISLVIVGSLLQKFYSDTGEKFLASPYLS